MVSKLFMNISFEARAAVRPEKSGREKKGSLGCLHNAVKLSSDSIVEVC